MTIRANGWRRVLPQIGDGGSEATAAPVQTHPPRDLATTFLNATCEIDGRLVVEHSIWVECEFRGSLESTRTVTIGEQAALEAGVQARTVVVHGAVVGDLRGSREVVLHPTARVHGDIETPSLVIERGAVLNGQTRMFRPEQNLRAARAPKPELPRPAPEAHA
jgi:cytoskeletal protein CcmA (bactofilin family)